MSNVTIEGEVGVRNDGSIDISTQLGLTTVVWNVDWTEDSDKFIISLTDCNELGEHQPEYNILHSFECDDDVEVRVEIAELVREWYPMETEEYIDCLKELAYQAWADPLQARALLAAHVLIRQLRIGDESWD